MVFDEQFSGGTNLPGQRDKCGFVCAPDELQVRLAWLAWSLLRRAQLHGRSCCPCDDPPGAIFAFSQTGCFHRNLHSPCQLNSLPPPHPGLALQVIEDKEDPPGVIFFFRQAGRFFLN